MRLDAYMLQDKEGNLVLLEETYLVFSVAEFRRALLETTILGLPSALLRLWKFIPNA